MGGGNGVIPAVRAGPMWGGINRFRKRTWGFVIINSDLGIMCRGRLVRMDGIENLAPFFVDVFTKAREIIEFSVAVPTLG